MRFLKKGVYHILTSYIMIGRIIVLYIYLARAKIAFYINAITLSNVAIYRSILPLIALIWAPHFNFRSSYILRILILILGVIKTFKSVRHVYFTYTFRLRFREKWISSYFFGINFISMFFIYWTQRSWTLVNRWQLDSQNFNFGARRY